MLLGKLGKFNLKKGKSKPVEDGAIPKSSNNYDGEVVDPSIQDDGIQLRVDSGEDSYDSDEGESTSSSESETSSESDSDDPDEARAYKGRKKEYQRSRKRSRDHDSPRLVKKSRRRDAVSERRGRLPSRESELWQLVDEIVDRRLAARAKEGKSSKKETKRPDKKQGSGKKLSRSHSMTTLYRPALKKQHFPLSPDKGNSPQKRGNAAQSLDKDIQRGIEAIRLQLSNPSNILSDRTADTRSRSVTPEEVRHKEKTPRDLAREEADQAILEAERFKASATTLPQGKQTPYDYNRDGEFLSSTCHIEPTID